MKITKIDIAPQNFGGAKLIELATDNVKYIEITRDMIQPDTSGGTDGYINLGIDLFGVDNYSIVFPAGFYTGDTGVTYNLNIVHNSDIPIVDTYNPLIIDTSILGNTNLTVNVIVLPQSFRATQILGSRLSRGGLYIPRANKALGAYSAYPIVEYPEDTYTNVTEPGV